MQRLLKMPKVSNYEYIAEETIILKRLFLVLSQQVLRIRITLIRIRIRNCFLVWRGSRSYLSLRWGSGSGSNLSILCWSGSGSYHSLFSPDLDPPMLQNNRLPHFHFDADPDSVPEMMRIVANPDPQHSVWSKSAGLFWKLTTEVIMSGLINVMENLFYETAQIPWNK